ncbi:CRYB [Mytilus coruscus]|uniref:CRYB n=1 Tax=Mytilus coruscus TaxID=42192 RepID=A0A6J8EXP7_MYTCO|nr:CRYB [Mytilus coruscus]
MSDGTKKGPKITLYEGANFKGRSMTFTEGHANMEDCGFYDCASSVIVEGGVWVLYQYHNYKGNICVVMEGDRSNLVGGTPTDKDTKVHQFNDSLSSLKPLEYDCTQEPRITIYEGDFTSRSLEFTEDILDFQWYNMNDKVSSIKVHSGVWVGYEAVNFFGRQSLFLPGEHRGRSTEGQFVNDTMSSLRPIQIKPSFPKIVDEIEYHFEKGKKTEAQLTVFSWTQRNNSKIPQKLSATKDSTTVTTEDWHVFDWEDKSTLIDKEYSFGVEVPFVFKSSFTLSVQQTLNIGITKDKKNIKTEKWSVVYPSYIPAQSVIKLESILTKGKIDVPFTAYFHQGDTKWTEKGIYRGVQHYNFDTKFNQEPILQ